MNDFLDISLVENADPRCPVALVLDSSSSMIEKRPGEEVSPLEALNSGLDTLITELHRDPLARRRVELSIISYGTEVSPPTPFATVDSLVLPTLVPSGVTSTGAAIVAALDAIEARKAEYKAAGLSFYRPWLMLISDGLSTDDVSEASRRLKEAEEQKKVLFFPVGVDGAEMEQLSALSGKQALKLQGTKFSELFQWLSASQSRVSASNPGEGVKLPAPTGWAEIEV